MAPSIIHGFMLSYVHHATRYGEMAPETRPQFDLIFVDGDKRSYQDYYDTILSLKLLSPTGLIIFDNALWKGLLSDVANNLAEGGDGSLKEEDYGAKFTARQLKLAKDLHGFNTYVRLDPRTEQSMLPIRDGLLFVRWKGFERRTQ